MSLRSSAARRGFSETAVSKTIARRQITILPDGTIDSVQADSESCAQTDPAEHMGPRAAIGAVADKPRNSARGPNRTEATGHAEPLRHARIANKVLKFQNTMV